MFSYGGITFENYRGQGDVRIEDDEARVVPLGVPELFRQIFAPADMMSAVNTLGKVKYSLAVPDPSARTSHRDGSPVQPITFCTRPRVLRRLVIGA